MREFANTDANHLGVPLPKGRVRFYRRDQDGQVEFTGENQIEHTPKDETVRVYTGNAFDITGERRQTKFQSQMQPGGWADESFEIKLRNHKKEAATVRVVEHLYRWSNWVITQESATHRQTDSRTVEYEVTLKPDYKMVGVIFDCPKGPYYVRLVGPAKTVGEYKKGFDEWLKAFK